MPKTTIKLAAGQSAFSIENYGVLVDLGLAEGTDERRYLSRLATKACCKIAKTDSLTGSLSRLVTAAEQYSKAADRNLKKDFRNARLQLWTLRDEQSRSARQAETVDG